MSRRLSRAKELLKSRLSKRGMAMSAVLLAAAVFARPASACAPAPLLTSTVKAATLVSQGVRVRDVVSPFAAQVVEEVAKSLPGGYKLTLSLLGAAASFLIATSVVTWHIFAPPDVNLFRATPQPTIILPPITNRPGTSASISIQAPKSWTEAQKKPQPMVPETRGVEPSKSQP